MDFKICLLPRSMAAARCLVFNLKVTAFCGQISSQFLHCRHSVLRQNSPVPDTAFPWQTELQTPHEVHPSLTDLFRKEKRDRMPRSAPSGQRYLHQKRFSIRFKPSTVKKNAPFGGPVPADVRFYDDDISARNKFFYSAHGIHCRFYELFRRPAPGHNQVRTGSLLCSFCQRF